MPNYFKEIDDWFLHYYTCRVPKAPPEKKAYITIPSYKQLKFKTGVALRNFEAASKHHPEVMVKIPRRRGDSNGLRGVRNHLDYISRNGKIELETSDGFILSGKNDTRELLKDWNALNIPEESNRREALNVVLSMPPGTDPIGLKNAAREFAKELFADHEYVMAQHLDTKHPHIHLAVVMRDRNGHRLNPRKNDLFHWRVLLAEKLRAEGIQCAATRRQHRGKSMKAENNAVHHVKKSGRIPYRYIQAAEAVAKAIKTNKQPEHPFLQKVLKTQGIMINEYSKISRELYKRGYKTEAKAVSNLAKMVAKNEHQTRAQQSYILAQQLIKNNKNKTRER